VGRYLFRKASFYAVTFVVAVTVDWAIPRFMPGDPIQGLLARMQAQPGSQDAVLPAMWRNYLQMTGIDMLTHLQAAR
jgi:peptide/nickel transport system permease protein